MKIVSLTKHWYVFLFYFIVGMTIILLVWGLPKSSPTNDEAVYIVIGQEGLFRHDWTELNPAGWVGGYIKLYPVVSALSYQLLGITGSRLLSVFSIVILLEITMIFGFVFSSKKPQAMKIGIISSVLLLTAPAFWRVGRLATYDSLSYVLFFLSIVSFIKAVQDTSLSGKWFFFSSLAFLVSLLTKYSVFIYLPGWLAFSYYLIYKKQPEVKKIYLLYFFTPLLGGIVSYSLIYFSDLITFYFSQIASQEAVPFFLLENFFNKELLFFLPWFIAGTIGMFFQKKWKTWLLLSGSGLLMIIVHLFGKRLETFDKHILISIVFFSLVAGIGITRVIDSLPKMSRFLFIPCLALIFLHQISNAYATVRHEQEDTREIESFLSSQVVSTDRVLTETGPSVMLKLASKISPTHITTFDWFLYKDISDETSYQQAVIDGYFSYIEVSKPMFSDTEAVREKREYITDNIFPHYTQVFETDRQIVYKRTYD